MENKNTRYSIRVAAFHGRKLPEPGYIVGYAAIIDVLNLEVPIPDVIALISDKNKRYEREGWKVLTPRYKPEETLYRQLVFALKYEGVNLLLFKKLFESIKQDEIIALLDHEPTGIYSRKIWFLYEWLMEDMLPIPNLSFKQSIPLIDDKLQYTIKGKTSPRHRIINNLPGNVHFCPLIRKTEKLNEYIKADVKNQQSTYLKNFHKDILQRASAYLLLTDSKASFTIEGESPKSKRATRWGNAIGQAGNNDLSEEELIRLQQIVIENDKFVEMGFRTKGGFVGIHDRSTGEPLPDHISARWEDIDLLITGLLEANELLIDSEMDPVLIATIISFGFVFIHPFEDGNGRIHRYLIHHVLSKSGHTQQGIIFPVSASILDRIIDYRKTLESYSSPLLDYIKWEENDDHNVEVLNETIDYYRYFDATKQAEFLYECFEDTITRIIPEEVMYLQAFDQFKYYIDDALEMPDRMVALLVRFLEQNQGRLSSRAKKKEFKVLTESECQEIEKRYREIFGDI